MPREQGSCARQKWELLFGTRDRESEGVGPNSAQSAKMRLFVGLGVGKQAYGQSGPPNIVVGGGLWVWACKCILTSLGLVLCSHERAKVYSKMSNKLPSIIAWCRAYIYIICVCV